MKNDDDIFLSIIYQHVEEMHTMLEKSWLRWSIIFGVNWVEIYNLIICLFVFVWTVQDVVSPPGSV